MKLTKKRKFKSFSSRSLTLWARPAAGSSTKSLRGKSFLPCTYVSTACKKQLCFEENWRNFLKMLVLSHNLPYLLRHNRLRLHFLFFFEMPIFERIPVLNGLSKSIALVQKWKSVIFRNFLLVSKWNIQKRANLHLLLAHH